MRYSQSMFLMYNTMILLAISICISCQNENKDSLSQSYDFGTLIDERARLLKYEDSLSISDNLFELINHQSRNDLSVQQLSNIYIDAVVKFREKQNYALSELLANISLNDKFLTGNIDHKSRILKECSIINFYLYEYDKAISLIEESLELEYTRPEKSIENILESHSVRIKIYIDKRDFDKAKEGLFLYEQILKENNISDYELDAMWGRFYDFQLKYEEAIPYYKKALEMATFRNYDDSIGIAIVHDLLTDIYVDQKKFEAAFDHSDTSALLRRFSFGNKTEEMDVLSSRHLLTRASIFLEEAVEKKLVSGLDSALTIVHQVKDAWLRSDINFDYDNFLNVQASLFSIAEYEIEIYYHLHRLTNKGEYKQILCDLLNKWKKTDHNFSDVDTPNLKKRYKEIERLKLVMEVEPSHETEKKLYSELQKFHTGMSDNSVFSYSLLDIKNTTVDTSRIINICADNKAMILDYYIGHDGFTLKITYSGNGIQMSEINPYDFVAETSELVDSLKFVNEYNYINAAQTLYRSLIGSVDSNIQYLTIIPSSILQKLPFGMLIEDQAISSKEELEFSDFLEDKYYCSYQYSISGIDENYYKKQGLSKDDQPLVYGYAYSDNDTYNSDIDDDLPELAGSFRELESIEKYYSYNKSSLFTGMRATKKHFLTNIHKADILHLALHAKSDDNSRLQNKIYFRVNNTHVDNTEKILYPYELLNTGINAKLVVLSACETNSGTMYSNTGVLSMARAFSDEGVPHIISNLWLISDNTSSQIFDSFYKNLAATGDMFASFQKAKADYYNTQNSTNRHPYYWAGLISQ